jgi:hypothetical protein
LELEQGLENHHQPWENIPENPQASSLKNFHTVISVTARVAMKHSWQVFCFVDRGT